MFSPLARGVGTWDGDLRLEQLRWDSDCYKHEHPATIDELPHRHGITVSPRIKSATGGRASRTEKSDGEIILPKTFITRKGALMLLSTTEEAELSTKQQEYLESCNRMLKDPYEDYVAGVGSLPRLMKSVLIYGDEDYERENTSVMDAGNKTCLHFVHNEDEQAQTQAQPGGEVSEYLRDLHKARVQSALSRMSSSKNTSDAPGKLSADADSLIEQFSKPINSTASRLPEERAQSACSFPGTRSHRVLSVEKLASSLKSASYLGRPSPYQSMMDLQHHEADEISHPPTPASSMTSMKSHLAKSWVLSRSRTSLECVSPIPQDVEEEQKMDVDGIELDCITSHRTMSRPSSIATESVAVDTELLEGEILMPLDEEERDPMGITAPLHPVYSGLMESSTTFSLADSTGVQSVQDGEPLGSRQRLEDVTRPVSVRLHSSTSSHSMEGTQITTLIPDSQETKQSQPTDDEKMSTASSHWELPTDKSANSHVEQIPHRQPSPSPSFDRDSLEGSITDLPGVRLSQRAEGDVDMQLMQDVAEKNLSTPHQDIETEKSANPVAYETDTGDELVEKLVEAELPHAQENVPFVLMPQPPASDRPVSSRVRIKSITQVTPNIENPEKSVDLDAKDNLPKLGSESVTAESASTGRPKTANLTKKTSTRLTGSGKKQVTVTNQKSHQKTKTSSPEQPSKSAVKPSSHLHVDKPEQENVLKDRQKQIQKMLGKSESVKMKTPPVSHPVMPAAPPEQTQEEKEVEKLEKELNGLMNHEVESTEGGLTAEELALEEQQLREKMKAAEERLKGTPSTKPTKIKASTDGKKKKKKTEMSDEKKENLAKQQEALREARQLEKQRRLDEARKLEEKVKEKEIEQATQSAEAERKKQELEEEIATMAEEAEEAKRAEEEARQVLAEARKLQRVERETRRKAEVERRKQEAIRHRDEERRMSEDAKRKEQEMLMKIADAQQRRHSEREIQDLAMEETVEEEDDAQITKRIEDEEEEKIAEMERQAEEEAMARLISEREEAEERKQRLEWAAAQMERDWQQRQEEVVMENQRLQDERVRWEAEQERQRDVERQRLEEFHRMQEDAKMRMQQEFDQRRQVAVNRRSKNLDRRSHMTHLARGQGLTKPWQFTYYVHWPRETYEKLMGEDPKKKKGFGGSRKRKPKP